MIDISVYQIAATAVSNDNLSVTVTTKKHNLCHVTLFRYIKKKENCEHIGSAQLLRVGYRSMKFVFTDEEEKLMSDCIIKTSDLFYGLSSKDIHKFAYKLE